MVDNYGVSFTNAEITDVDIANMALVEIGGGQVNSLTDIEELSAIFNPCKYKIMGAYDWAFNMTDVQLYPSPIALANSLKANLNAHGADNTIHTNADTTNFPLTMADATDMASLYALTKSLLDAYAAHNADAELAASWVFHRAQEPTDQVFSLESDTMPTIQKDAVERLNDLLEKFNMHDAESVSHINYDQHLETKMDCELPEFGWEYAYYLPTDYLGGARLKEQTSSYPQRYYNSNYTLGGFPVLRTDVFFVLKGNKIYSNESSLNLTYRARKNNNIIYTWQFIECFSLLLASKLAMSVAQDKSLADILHREYLTALQDNLAIDAREGNPDERPTETSWNSRSI